MGIQAADHCLATNCMTCTTDTLATCGNADAGTDATCAKAQCYSGSQVKQDGTIIAVRGCTDATGTAGSACDDKTMYVACADKAATAPNKVAITLKVATDFYSCYKCALLATANCLTPGDTTGKCYQKAAAATDKKCYYFSKTNTADDRGCGACPSATDCTDTTGEKSNNKDLKTSDGNNSSSSSTLLVNAVLLF